MMDIAMDGINHNLRKRLDIIFYQHCVILLAQVLSHLTKTRTKLVYHWSELWRSLLSFTRFLTTYADDLKTLPDITQMVESLVDLLTTALSLGEAFLPDAASYDDLFYKLVESGDALVKFRDIYALSKPDANTPINTLISVSRHYRELIETQKKQKHAFNTTRGEQDHKTRIRYSVNRNSRRVGSHREVPRSGS